MSNISFVEGKSTIKWITFSDGTETCKVTLQHGHPAACDGRIQCTVVDGTRDLIRLGLVKDALDRLGVREVRLTLDYMPQARADRVFEAGNPLPIKVFCNILNSYKFSEVLISDPHSDVTSALIDNVVVQTQGTSLIQYIPRIKEALPDFSLCAPDLGATKKTFDIMQQLGHTSFVQAIKVRDVTTGSIVKCDVVGTSVSGNVLIVDDISDGGASFKFLSQKLKDLGADKVGLYVTHGIFSQGLSGLEKDIDFIWCSGLVGSYINNEDIWRFNERG